ncbi:hypothetical protein J6590_064233, partial [Homalodisca vitripennis]
MEAIRGTSRRRRVEASTEMKSARCNYGHNPRDVQSCAALRNDVIMTSYGLGHLARPCTLSLSSASQDVSPPRILRHLFVKDCVGIS